MKKDLPMILIVSAVTLILVISLIFGATNFASQTKPTAVSGTYTPIFATNSPAPTITPDICSPENIAAEVDTLHKITREFDDTFGLAQTLRIEDAIPLVQDMQRIKRSAEDLSVPPCLTKLKEYQLLYMNTGIELFTTVYSVTTSNPNISQNNLNAITAPLFENILGAAKLYLDQQSKLMGWTPIPIPTLENSLTITPTP